MKLHFRGDLKGLEGGLKELEREGIFTADADGIPVHVERIADNRLRVFQNGREGRIQYHRPIHFFRGVGLLVQAFGENGPSVITEEPQFTTIGAMFDNSRNAVFQPETLKGVLRKMALMGLNLLMLYTEDTYSVDGEPYFGYMRGRYTLKELRELDDYAALFGIEMIPCIQTLAHLSSFLQWARAEELRDTDDVLLADSDVTYRFIDSLIRSASKPYRSRRIHIGMDEAFGLGRGRYLDLNGHRRTFDIMSRHLRQVLEITSRYGLRPMIWSDMYFRMASPTRDYYDLDAEIPADVIRDMPRDVQLVYWDYYHSDPDFYERFIRKHRAFGSMPVFAGGIWTWAGPAIHYEKTFATTNAALAACKKEGVREVFATLWGDDGAETHMLSGMLGLQWFAEHGYAKKPDPEKLRKRFAVCTGGDAEAFLNLGRFDTLPEADWTGLVPDNPSKYLLWQDVLIGLFDRHVEGTRAVEHYARLHETLKRDAEKAGEWEWLFRVPVRLSQVLAQKSEIGVKIKRWYDAGDRRKLREVAEVQLPELARCIEDLRRAHRDQWMNTYKPFGWEVLDIRYGGLVARVETAIQRLLDWVDGKTDRLEELEAERLGFDGYRKDRTPGMGKAVLYSRIATASQMGFR